VSRKLWTPVDTWGEDNFHLKIDDCSQKQGDQIGEFFPQRAIAYFGQFFSKITEAAQILAIFSIVEDMH
jgi:hypothetical protein